MVDTTTRRSNRAVKPNESPAPVNTPATETKKTTTTTTATLEDVDVPKRGRGRPIGSFKKGKPVVPVSTEPKVPGKRGRKPLPSTVIARAAAAAAAETLAAAAAVSGNGGVKLEDQVSNLEVIPGMKRQSDESDHTSVKRAAVEITTAGEENKRGRGRPAGTGKKQIAAAATAAKAVSKDKTVPKTEPTSTTVKTDDAASDFSDIKLTIERCTTCTQYHRNVLRIQKITKELYPHALVHEEVLPQSKSFEIYVSVKGAPNKLIWSGKAHAPPKRLAFPDNDVFIDLLKDALKEK
ncbi:hypothetical protein BGZ83_001796 [Gryganskiella cystojenkinii]|nr:hypothetical protein BGZ83_001796 [Gryganskiella cystojenkinii]